jgi:DHA2 family multidrug resistance protein-like MFS transporter
MRPNLATPRATAREWIGLAVIALPCVLYSMDLTVLNLAVPRLSADLQPSSAQLLWIVDIYGFLLAGSLITMGTLGDRIGRRKLLMIGAAAFGGASVLTAFSASAAQLIASRGLLGVAAATLAPSTLSLIRNMFADAGQRTTAIAVWVASFSAGAAIGPVVGGALLEHFWWGSVFLVAVPVMVLLLVLGPVLLPEFRNADAGRLDLVSAALSMAAVLTVIYGLKQIAQAGIGRWSTLSILAGLAVGVVFVRRQHALPDPLIDLRLFRKSDFAAALTTNVLDFFVGFGIFLFIAQYLQSVLGLSPLHAGLWTVPWAIGFIVGSMLTPVLVRRLRPAFVMAAGLVVAAVGFGVLTQVRVVPGLTVLVTGSVFLSLGLAPMTTLATDIMVGMVPPERAGAASSISETSSEFGGALGIAVLGSIGTLVYRNHVTGAIPADVPVEAADAVLSTLGGAVAVAGQLPVRDGAALLHVARAAFAQSFAVAAWISAVIVIAMAMATAVLLRHVRAGSAGPPDPDNRLDPTEGATAGDRGDGVGTGRMPPAAIRR